MMDITIKLWQEKDLETIKNLSTHLCEYDRNHFDSSLQCNWLDTSYWKKLLTTLLNNIDSCIFLAEYKGEIIGYLFWEIVEKIPWRNIKKQAELMEIYVIEKYRGNMIWNKLVDAFKEWANEKWVTNISVLVSYWNEKSINFYKKNWFKNYDITLEYNI